MAIRILVFLALGIDSVHFTLQVLHALFKGGHFVLKHGFAVFRCRRCYRCLRPVPGHSTTEAGVSAAVAPGHSTAGPGPSAAHAASAAPGHSAARSRCTCISGGIVAGAKSKRPSCHWSHSVGSCSVSSWHNVPPRDFLPLIVY